jgi:hypothetical protein
MREIDAEFKRVSHQNYKMTAKKTGDRTGFQTLHKLSVRFISVKIVIVRL